MKDLKVVRNARNASSNWSHNGRRFRRLTILITDGRFSGATRGGSIGHVAPEAAVGGPIGLVNFGDIITLDIETRQLNVNISDEEMKKRKDAWVPRKPNYERGV